MISLVMRRGPTPGQVYTLVNDEVMIGRGIKNQIVIDDNSVSREHCRFIRLNEDLYEVHDLNSADGTFVNGQRVHAPTILRRGAVIELGEAITLEYGVADSQIFVLPDYVQRLVPNGHMPAFGDTSSGPAAPRYSLMMLEGPAVGYIYNLEGDGIRIGRDLSNDVVIQDPEVSRYHITLTRTKCGFTVEDLNSTNGSYVNDVPLHEARALAANDVLRLGSLVRLQLLRVEANETVEDAAARAMPRNRRADKTLEMLRGDTLAVRPNVSTGIESGSLGDSIMLVYARDDWQTVVAPLLVSLQDGGLKVWVEQYLLPTTEEWHAAVTQALQETWLMVVVASPQAMSHPANRAMFLHFLRERKPVISFLVDTQLQLPAELSRTRGIAYDPLNASRSYHKLIFEIRQFWRQRI